MSSNHYLSADMLVFRGVHVLSCKYLVDTVEHMPIAFDRKVIFCSSKIFFAETWEYHRIPITTHYLCWSQIVWLFHLPKLHKACYFVRQSFPFWTLSHGCGLTKELGPKFTKKLPLNTEKTSEIAVCLFDDWQTLLKLKPWMLSIWRCWIQSFSFLN